MAYRREKELSRGTAPRVALNPGRGLGFHPLPHPMDQSSQAGCPGTGTVKQGHTIASTLNGLPVVPGAGT